MEKVFLPKLSLWYSADFGKDMKSRVAKLLLNTTKRVLVEKLFPTRSPRRLREEKRRKEKRREKKRRGEKRREENRTEEKKEKRRQN